MSAWGLDRFMVRTWKAIDRLLWIVALAYMLVRLVLHSHRRLRAFRQQCRTILKHFALLGRSLTLGKLAEAVGLDYDRHLEAGTQLQV
jgi:hypothetical protein